MNMINNVEAVFNNPFVFRDRFSVLTKKPVAEQNSRDYVLITMSLADRTYMRDEYSGRAWSPTIVILVINVVVFLLEASGGARSHQLFREYGAVSLEGIKHGFVWQLLTYQFMHGGLTHLLLNSIGLYLFGRYMEMMLGRNTFLKL